MDLLTYVIRDGILNDDLGIQGSTDRICTIVAEPFLCPRRPHANGCGQWEGKGREDYKQEFYSRGEADW